jgi:hypothetical protein
MRHAPLPCRVAVLLALAPATAAPPPTAGEVRAALGRGETAKAARLAEEALASAPAGEIPALRYLRFKAYVLDLTPGREELFRKVTDEARRKDKQASYDDLVGRLEGEVRAEGAGVLPVLVEALASGEPLDRLLSLGILEDLAVAGADLPWSTPAAGRSPVDAARSATLAALDDCANREDALGAKPAYAIEDQRERDPYVEAVYAAEAGLEFLARADAPSWGIVAAFALECRGAAGAVLDDRARAQALAAALLPPLRERLARSRRPAASLDAVDLLGSLGDCADLGPVRALAAGGGDLGDAAAVAADRIARRHECPAP